jgi:hypothetical protein
LLPQIPAVFAKLPHFYHAVQRRACAFAVNGLVMTAIGSAARAQQTPASRSAPPPPDVYLATVKVAEGRPSIGAVLNITARSGYDNQPSFSGDEAGIYFTSVRENGQADIYRYEIGSRRTIRVTASAPESEYSATPIENGRAISVIRVERDSTQRLWRFPLDGGAPSVILERIRPVGYHAWADDHTVAVFVLGSPNSLQLADTRAGSADTIATGIGRSLHRIPGTNRISFVRKVSAAEWWIESLDPVTRATTRLVQLPAGVEDYAWFPDGSIICGHGSRLLWWSNKPGVDWQEVGDLSSEGVHGITRLAVSAHGDRLALVADGKP